MDWVCKDLKAFSEWWTRRYRRIDEGGWPTRGETVEEC
jgi:hypothetical protein